MKKVDEGKRSGEGVEGKGGKSDCRKLMRERAERLGRKGRNELLKKKWRKEGEEAKARKLKEDGRKRLFKARMKRKKGFGGVEEQIVKKEIMKKFLSKLLRTDKEMSIRE